VGLFRSKEKDELIRELGRLAGMQQALPNENDDAYKSPEVKAQCSNLLAQSEHCLVLLDKLQAAIPRRDRAKLAGTWEPIRASLHQDIMLYSFLSHPPPDDE
jgi:hypothetical protein